MNKDNNIIPEPIDKGEYDVYWFQPYFVDTIKAVLEMAQDKDVLLSYCREKPDTEITLDKRITYGVLFPSKRRQDFDDMIDRIEWSDSDSYILPDDPENKRQERTNMIKTHLERILGMSDELNRMIECYV